MQSIVPQWLQDIETLASLIGAILTLLVLRTVSEVRLSFQRRTRLPEISRDLAKYASDLNAALGAADIISAKTQIKSSRSLLVTARKLMPSDSAKELKLIIKRLDISKKRNHICQDNLDSAWEIYSDLQTSIQIIKQETKNVRWA
ncbi:MULTISPECIES: hypothetical protein [Xanthomonas]|uniref:hypothetical protein n=1 Tax=Xanthomonas TaxID=338 RepID=UPI000594317B|nr:hypothetical protein [Xanthomonas campestris]MCC5044727.1 hypothetical protein [Xanthomonas campestris]